MWTSPCVSAGVMTSRLLRFRHRARGSFTSGIGARLDRSIADELFSRATNEIEHRSLTHLQSVQIRTWRTAFLFLSISGRASPPELGHYREFYY